MNASILVRSHYSDQNRDPPHLCVSQSSSELPGSACNGFRHATNGLTVRVLLVGESILEEAGETMTFSIFEWRCPNIHGEGLFSDMLLIIFGILFLTGSFARDLKLGRTPESTIPAPPSARVIIFMIGCLLVFEGTKLILLCR
jgi:hypothetical protein